MTTTPQQPALVLRHLTRSFHGPHAAVHAVDHVSLTVAPGEFLAVVGASGSGKSTLLHCAAGLETATSGNVVMAGTDITALPRSQRARFRAQHVGFVFQDYNLVSALTACDNVRLPARIAGRHLPSETIADALRAVGLEDRADRYPHELSGGERQRVAIARVMAIRPEIVFADEPTAALDIASAAVVLDWLGRIARAGTTVVMVTHDLEAATRADRVIAMSEGRLVHQMLRPTRRELIGFLTPAREVAAHA